MERNFYKNMFADFPDVVTPKQLQEMIGVSKKTAYALIKDGTIKCRKIGREYKIPKCNVVRFFSNV